MIHGSQYKSRGVNVSAPKRTSSKGGIHLSAEGWSRLADCSSAIQLLILFLGRTAYAFAPVCVKVV